MFESLIKTLPKEYQELIQEIKANLDKNISFSIIITPPKIYIQEAPNMKVFEIPELFPQGGEK